MPGTNQFLPFAVGAGANTLTPTAYAALTSLLSSGFVAGVAPSAQFNTALRQATTAAAGLAQFIAKQGPNVNDDGSATNFAASLSTALGSFSSGRLLAVRVFTTANSGQTYTPTAGASSFIVEVQAPGGGSGGAPATGAGGYAGSPGAGSGSYAKCKLTAAQIGAGQVMTIPTGGTAGDAGSTTGGNGGTAGFGALISCPGGKGSANYGPTASTVTIMEGAGVAGAPSTTGTVLASSSGQIGGPAVGSTGGVARGIGGPSMSGNYGVGANGTAIGASAAAVAGNNGGDALITVWELA